MTWVDISFKPSYNRRYSRHYKCFCFQWSKDLQNVG